MPFLIPLIPVLTGAVTGLAATVAIGSAVVGGLGYITKDEDLMKIGGLLGIASLATGIVTSPDAAGYEAAGELSAETLEEEAAAGALSQSASGAADAANVTGAVEGVPEFVDYSNFGNGIIQDNLNQSPLAPVEDRPMFNIIEDAMSGNNNPAGQTPINAADPNGVYGDNMADTQSPSYEDWYRGHSNLVTSSPQDPADGIIKNLVGGWNNLGDRSKAAAIQIGGNALASAFNDLPEKKYKAELAELRRRIANANNIGMIQLGMNPTPVPGNKY